MWGRAVEAQRIRRAKRDLPAALTGALSHFGLSTVLTVLEMERRTGVLDLRADGITGRIVLRDGQVIQAEIPDDGVRGVEAIYRLLGWVSGGFIFRVGEVSAANDVGLSTSMLLLEAARRADELAA
jgi:two-component system OmpR family response regulator